MSVDNDCTNPEDTEIRWTPLCNWDKDDTNDEDWKANHGANSWLTVWQKQPEAKLHNDPLDVLYEVPWDDINGSIDYMQCVDVHKDVTTTTDSRQKCTVPSHTKMTDAHDDTSLDQQTWSDISWSEQVSVDVAAKVAVLSKSCSVLRSRRRILCAYLVDQLPTTRGFSDQTINRLGKLVDRSAKQVLKWFVNTRDRQKHHFVTFRMELEQMATAPTTLTARVAWVMTCLARCYPERPMSKRTRREVVHADVASYLVCTQ
jgi:hypothetical protein